MNILYVTHFLNGLLMIGMPVALVIILNHRWKLGGRIWWFGALTFVLSQVGHIPFNKWVEPVFNQAGFNSLHPTVQLLLLALFYGLSAGIFEEGARYLMLRFKLKEARSWRTGILFGAGHAGAEAIIFGVLVLYAYIQMVVVRNLTPEQLSQAVGASNVALAQSQISSYWSAAWPMTLLGALERFFTIPCQITMSVMVMQVFTRKNIGWLFAAVGYHALIDSVAVIGVSKINVYGLEAIIGGFAVLSLVIIYLLRLPEPQPEPEPAPTIPMSIPVIQPLEETPENLESSRYQS